MQLLSDSEIQRIKDANLHDERFGKVNAALDKAKAKYEEDCKKLADYLSQEIKEKGYKGVGKIDCDPMLVSDSTTFKNDFAVTFKFDVSYVGSLAEAKKQLEPILNAFRGTCGELHIDINDSLFSPYEVVERSTGGKNASVRMKLERKEGFEKLVSYMDTIRRFEEYQHAVQTILTPSPDASKPLLKINTGLLSTHNRVHYRIPEMDGVDWTDMRQLKARGIVDICRRTEPTTGLNEVLIEVCDLSRFFFLMGNSQDDILLASALSAPPEAVSDFSVSGGHHSAHAIPLSLSFLRQTLRLEDDERAPESGTFFKPAPRAGGSGTRSTSPDIEAQLGDIHRLIENYQAYFQEYKTYCELCSALRGIPDPQNEKLNELFEALETTERMLDKTLIEGTALGVLMAKASFLQTYYNMAIQEKFDWPTLEEFLFCGIGNSQQAAGQKVWERYYARDNMEGKSHLRSNWAESLAKGEELGKTGFLSAWRGLWTRSEMSATPKWTLIRTDVCRDGLSLVKQIRSQLDFAKKPESEFRVVAASTLR